MKNTNALRKEILLIRIELRREQLKMSADSLKEKFRNRQGSAIAPPEIQTLMMLALPCGIYFGSRRNVKFAEALRMGLSSVKLLNRLVPLLRPTRNV